MTAGAVVVWVTEGTWRSTVDAAAAAPADAAVCCSTSSMPALRRRWMAPIKRYPGASDAAAIPETRSGRPPQARRWTYWPLHQPASAAQPVRTCGRVGGTTTASDRLAGQPAATVAT